MFIDFLLRNNISNKLYILGFISAVTAYSLWQPLEELTNLSKGSIFYIGIAFSFACYSSAYMFTKWDKWRWFPMFVTFICLSRVGSEVYFSLYPDENPEKYNIFDYINFLITIWIVFSYYLKWQFNKYKAMCR